MTSSVLLPIVPDLATMLARPVLPAATLDAPSTHGRLLEVVLAILRRQRQPVVFLLEDLQRLLTLSQIG